MAATTEALAFGKYPFLARLGLKEENEGVFDGTWFANGAWQTQYNPSTGEALARVRTGTREDYEKCLATMEAARVQWASLGAPRRGEIVRQIGEKVRAHIDDLGALVTLEMGKIRKVWVFLLSILLKKTAH